MPKNIVDAYRQVSNDKENGDFGKVVSFCEKDIECRDDTSLKRNVLMFWSYKKIAEFYENEKKYKKAYEFWQKALSVAFETSIKIKVAYRLLSLISKLHQPMREKAQEIVRICDFLQKEYIAFGNTENALRISKLQEKALNLLNKSKYLH